MANINNRIGKKRLNQIKPILIEFYEKYKKENPNEPIYFKTLSKLITEETQNPLLPSYQNLRPIYKYVIDEYLNILPPEDEFKPSSNLNVSDEEKDLIREFRRIKEEANGEGIDVKDVKHGWIKSKTASLFFKNPAFTDEEADIENIFEEIVLKHTNGIYKKFKRKNISQKKALKGTITDAHVGMDPNPDNRALFQYEYNADIFSYSMVKFFNSILKEHKTHGTFEVMFLDDLGDTADGWNGQTTRGGHHLPQNMNNGEVFEACVDTKVELVRNLIDAGVANKIVLRSVSNDNHCFTEDVEVLTDNGWKFYDEVTTDDLIGSYDTKSKEICFDKPVDVIINTSNCDIHHYQNKNVDLTVTDEHRMYTKNPNEKTNLSFGFRESKTTFKKSALKFKVSGLNTKKDINISDDWIKLCAWFLTDGTIRYYNNNPSDYIIYQSKVKNIDRIRTIANDLGLTFRESSRKIKVKEISGKKIGKDYLRNTEFAFNKKRSGEEALDTIRALVPSRDYLPEWVYSMSKRQFDIFINEWIIADGSKKVDTSATIYSRKGILDDLQILCVQNNTKCNISINNRGHYVMCVVFNKDEVSISPKKQCVVEKYSGITWCFTMPKSTLVVRKNGKVSIQGNSGSFSEVINIAIKKIINLIYSEEVVEVDMLTRFLEHRIYGDHCFILTHGKDTTDRKFGLPLNLDAKTTNYINDYIDHYGINSKYIHLEKGDLHQIGYQRVKKFDYRNFMSFAPPSKWVQHNFGDSYSGYSIQVIPKHSSEISHTDYFLEYNKVNKKTDEDAISSEGEGRKTDF